VKPAHAIGGLAIVAGAAWLLSGDDDPSASAGGPSAWFTWAQVEASATATRRGLPNVAPPEVRARAEVLARRVLDPLQARVGRLTVTSWYRSPAVNAAAGGSATSDHMTGAAADVTAPGLTSRELARAVLELGLGFDQMIAYASTTHLHLSTRWPDTDRRQIRMKQANGSLTPWDPA
jgi:zinc D-Ala-D-Ala carboxypeptidase